jgi:hypothetical protein
VLNTADPPGDGPSDRHLAVRLLTAGGSSAWQPTHRILHRSTRFADGRQVAGYELPGEPPFADETALRHWCARHELTDDRLLDVAVLVIQEELDSHGLIRTCVLERRVGSASGPFRGAPARVEFAGPAQHVRTWRVAGQGRLVDQAPVPLAGREPGELDPDLAGAADAALRARFGSALTLLDHRKPTLAEDMVGLASVAHLRLPDGRDIACGIGWFGPLPFVLAADFPRLENRTDLPPRQEAMVTAALAAHELVRYELRADDHGLAVMARQADGTDLFVIRPSADAAQVEPYQPSRSVQAGEDQQRWLRYVETYELRRVLDVWRAPAGDEIVALTVDPDGHVWRHHVDTDGVELARAPAEATALASLLHRAADAAPDLPALPPLPDPAEPPARPRAPAPPGSLLAKAQAVSDALSALHEARFACTEAAADADLPAAALRHTRNVPAPLRFLGLSLSAAATLDLLRRADLGTVDAAGFRDELERIEARLTDELAMRQVVALGPAWPAAAADDALLGHFPGAAWHLNEARECLALHRPSAALLHAMKVVSLALSAAGPALGLAEVPSDWRGLIVALRRSARRPLAVIEAVDGLARCWQSSGVIPADKYTEAEAAAALDAVTLFLQALAAAVD